MENIVKVAQGIFTAFIAKNTITCTTEDTCPDDYMEIDDHIILGCDNEKDTWNIEFRVEGNTHDNVKDVLVTLFGKPIAEHARHDLPPGVKVNNWMIDDVTVVQLNDDISLFQYFKRVSRKQR